MKVIKQILIVAGEASGDLHAAHLVKMVHAKDSTVHFFGMGGDKSREAGVNTIVNSDAVAVIGVFDLMLNFWRIWRAFHRLRRALIEQHPDLVILVDYPGFNLRFAKLAKRMGVKVLYYIAPKLWASRPKRIKAIRQYVDQLAVIFPFEVDYYRNLGVAASFVGNPLLLLQQTTETKQQIRRELQLNSDATVIGLFPGSRSAEIKRMLPVMLDAAAELAKETRVEFVLPVASSLSAADLKPYIDASKLPVKLLTNSVAHAMVISDVAIAVSGTITLQLALAKVPMVIIYKITPSFLRFEWVLSISNIGLCNIVAGKRIVKELWQQQVNAENISNEIKRLIADKAYRFAEINELEKVRAKLEGAKQHDLAELVLSMLN